MKLSDQALISEFEVRAFAEMEVQAGHGWDHIQRVITNGQKLAREEGADELVVHLACLMHDLVNLPKDDPRRGEASTLSAEKAAEWLEGRLSQERINLVYEAVKCHSFSAGFVPKSLEAKVVSDADNLDALGAIGIARTFECGGSMLRQTLCMFDPLAEDREVDDSKFTLDHFFAKLLKLGDRFYTEAGQKAARRRIEFMERFVEELHGEVSW